MPECSTSSRAKAPLNALPSFSPKRPSARLSRSNSPTSIYRFRALPALIRELQEGADHLADLSEAEFERFATLQQQVASVGSQHAADDAGDRDAGRAAQGEVAQVMREKGPWRRGSRPVRQE